MLVGMLKWIPWRMRTAMVGKDKIWSGEVNRHLNREKNLNFWEKKAPPTKGTKWNEFVRMYLDGVKYVNIHYWKDLDTPSFWYYLNRWRIMIWRVENVVYHFFVDVKQPG